MPRSHPDATTLLRVAIDHLEGELYPTLGGPARYRLRVAINALRIVLRENELGPALHAEELADLAELMTARDEELTDDALSRAIEAGELSIDDPKLRAFLPRSLARALRINNPRWIGEEPSPIDNNNRGLT